MSLDFYRRLSYIFGFMLIFILLGYALFAANIEIKDYDLWLHIKMGEFITQHGYVPEVDVLSATVAGKPWVNHEWLFQVLVFHIYDLFGPDGLITMQVVVVAVTFALLIIMGYHKDRQLGIAFLLLLVMMIYRVRFTIRPDIFSLLFFACYIYILAFYIDRRWSLLAIFVLQALWVNFHGFSFIGPFMVLVGILAELVKRHVPLPWQWNEAGRLDNEEFAQLQRIFFVSVLASFFNPMTFKGAWYPISVLLSIPSESKIFFENIVELQRPINGRTLFSPYVYPYYKLFILISGMSFIFNRKKIDIGDLLVWGLFLYASLMAVRNIVFFAFAAYLVCLTNFSNVKLNQILPVDIHDKKFVHITSIAVKIFFIFWILNQGIALSKQGYFDFDKYEMKSEFGGVSQRNFPNKAADFLIANNIRGRFFNDFNSGAYLIGRCYPDIRFFIDGRTEVYGSDFFKEYQKIWKGGDVEVLEAKLEEYELTGAFLNSVNKQIPDRILKYFMERNDWRLVYLDYDGVIFLKDIPLNRQVIEEHEIDPSQWSVEPMNLQRLGTITVTPYRFVSRAYSLGGLGFEEAAADEAREALKVSPGYAEPYKILGKYYGLKKDHQKAFENFRIATMIMSHDRQLRSNLGLAYERLGNMEGALRQYNVIMRQAPEQPKGYFLMAKAYAKMGDFAQAMPYLKKGLSMDPRAMKDAMTIGDILFEQDMVTNAIDVYSLMLDSAKYRARAHAKLSRCYELLGQENDAVFHREKALELDPEVFEQLEEEGAEGQEEPLAIGQADAD